MSFSKSKVERFPFNASRGIQTISKANKTPSSGILKRSYLLSSPSTSVMSASGSSFHSTPSKRDNFKQRRPLKKESESKYGTVSNSAGNRKSPVQRIPVLNRSHNTHNRTVITKPKCSPVYRGKVLNMTGKANQTTTPGKRKQLPTSGPKKTPTPKKKDSMPTPKRKKFDETPSEDLYLTPLTSPPHSNSSSDESSNDADASSSTIIFDPQSLSRCLEEAKKIKMIENEDQETFTPTAPFESTRLDVDVTPIPIRPSESESATEIRNGGDFSENLVEEVVISDMQEDESTVTTPGRNPGRKSITKQNVSFVESSSPDGSEGVTRDNVTFPYDEHTSRVPMASRTQQWNNGSELLDFMNDAFLQQQQLSLQGSERNSLFFQSSSANPQSAMWVSDDLHLGLSVTDCPRDSHSHRPRAQSFSCYTSHEFPGHGQVTTDESRAPIPPSIVSRIGGLISTIFPKKTKRDNVRSAAEVQILAEHNYLPQARNAIAKNLRLRPKRLGANSFIPMAFREFIFSEPPFRARFNREVLRRLARMIRIETVRTFGEIRVSVILPAKLYVKSPEFWMPVLEFVAGQAMEITLTSLTK